MQKIRIFLTKHKETILYLIFGGLTTLVSIGVFWLFDSIIGLDALIGNVLSWIIAVTFAFITNKFYVFEVKTKKGLLYQLLTFYSSRLLTFFFEEGMIAIFVTWLKFDSLMVKIILQVIVIIMNYFLSKFIVFRKKLKQSSNDNTETNGEEIL